MQNMSFHGAKRARTWFFGCKRFFKNPACRKIFNSKSNALYFFQSKKWGILKLLNQNLTRCENFVSKSVALEKLKSKSEKCQNLLSEFWPSSFFSISDWMMISSVHVNVNLFQRREVEDKVCYRFSCHMYNWKPPHLNWSLNKYGTALWQQINFTEVTDRTMWSIKCSKSAVSLKIHIRELKNNAP